MGISAPRRPPGSGRLWPGPCRGFPSGPGKQTNWRPPAGPVRPVICALTQAALFLPEFAAHVAKIAPWPGTDVQPTGGGQRPGRRAADLPWTDRASAALKQVQPSVLAQPDFQSIGRLEAAADVLLTALSSQQTNLGPDPRLPTAEGRRFAPRARSAIRDESRIKRPSMPKKETAAGRL